MHIEHAACTDNVYRWADPRTTYMMRFN